MHGDDIFVAGPRQDKTKIGATLKNKSETRDQMIGPRSDDRKELHILNHTLRWCKEGLVFAANLRLGGEVVDELGLSKSKPVLSPVTVGDNAQCQVGEIELLGEEVQCLYQRIVAKFYCLAHDRPRPEVCDILSSETSWTLPEKGTCRLARFSLP